MDYLSLFEILWFAVFVFWYGVMWVFFLTSFKCSPVNLAVEFSFYNCKEDVFINFFPSVCFTPSG